MKNYIRLSHTIKHDTPSYGNRDRILIQTNSSIKKGEASNSSCWIFSNNHIGTHIDTPHHFSEFGKKTDEMPINDFIFDKVQLIDIKCNDARLINADDLITFNKIIDKNTDLLLIRTGYEEFRQEDKYWNNNPGLAAGLAVYLRTNYTKLRCVGFDFISLTSWKFRDEGKKSHEAFLCPANGTKGILIIEDMALARINTTIRQVIVAPVFVEDGNGGPVTVIANIES